MIQANKCARIIEQFVYLNARLISKKLCSLREEQLRIREGVRMDEF